MSKKGSTKREPAHLKHLYKRSSSDLKGDKVVTLEESLIDGPKGISFKLYKKNGDKIEKYTGRQNPDGTFTLWIVKGGVKDKQEKIGIDDLMTIIKKVKDLAFVVKYMKKNAGKISRMIARMIKKRIVKRKRSRKKVSKKKSKKRSKKRSRKKVSKKNQRRDQRKDQRKDQKKDPRKDLKRDPRKDLKRDPGRDKSYAFGILQKAKK
uniref:Uncharacterized protein n=1 Tax=Mimivirus LCMiAC01 TaxID=2506608 RepID=A0A481YYV8_9VIRU|nr:MAG: hypothetical protein LCMiAC01_00030 [Mimivirus LCMiAC01]